MALFDILINLAANTASLESGFKRAEDTITQFASTVKSALEFGGITIGLSEMSSAISETVAKGDELTSLAGRIGSSVESLSQLQFAAATANVPFEELTGAMDRFSRNLVQASEGSGKARQALSDLGIDAAKLAALPLDQQLSIIADRIAALPNPTQQTAAAMRIFGQEGANLVPILKLGADGIEKLRAESDALGATLTTENAAKLEESRQAMVRLSAASQGLKDELVADLAPAIAGIETGLTSLIQKSKDMFASFGQQKVGTSDQAQLDALVRQITAESDELSKLNEATSARQQISQQGMVQTAANKIAELSGELAAIQSRIASTKLPTSGAAVSDTEQLPELNFSQNSHMLDTYYAKLLADSQTDVQETANSWQEKEDYARAAYADGLISAQQFADKVADLSTKFLTPVEVTAKYITKTVKPIFDDMEKYAQSAATSMQSSFATFLSDPSIDSFKKMGVAWLETLDKMAADAAASSIFKMLFGDTSTANLGVSLGGILGALFGTSAAGSSANVLDEVPSLGLDSLDGFANGGSFNVGGSGGVDSQLVAFKATPNENVTVGGGGTSSPIMIQNNITVTSPQVSKSDVLSAMAQTQNSTVSKLQDMKRRGKF